MNPSKTRSMLFSLKRDKIDHPELTLRGADIEVSSHTHLGRTFQNNMSWNKHVLETMNTWFGDSMKVQYNSLTMLVSVYARIWVYLVTCVLYFSPRN
jgi:hypothetical protein